MINSGNVYMFHEKTWQRVHVSRETPGNARLFHIKPLVPRACPKHTFWNNLAVSRFPRDVFFRITLK